MKKYYEFDGFGTGGGLPETKQILSKEEAIAEMDKAIRCLFLELPEQVAKDVQLRWNAVKASQQSSGLRWRSVPDEAYPKLGEETVMKYKDFVGVGVLDMDDDKTWITFISFSGNEGPTIETIIQQDFHLVEMLDESASPEAVDAVKFAEWIDGQGYECTLHTDDNIKLWEKYPDVQSTANRRARPESFTTAELYSLFKQSIP